MLLNEDFFDEQDIDVGVSSVNIDIESEKLYDAKQASC